MKKSKTKGYTSRLSKKKNFTSYHKVKTNFGTENTYLIIDLIEYNPEIIYYEIGAGRLSLNKESYSYFKMKLAELRPSLFAKLEAKGKKRVLIPIGTRPKY